MKKRKKKKIKYLPFKISPTLIKGSVFFILLIFIFGGTGFMVYKSDNFRVKKGSIHCNVQLDKNILNRIMGQSLFVIDIKAISADILERNPIFKKVSVVKKFPSSLIIEVEKRELFAQIKGKKFYPIDVDLIVLTNGQSNPYEGLISIEASNYEQYYKIGDEVINEKVRSSVNLVRAFKDNEFFKDSKIKSINSSSIQALYFILELNILDENKKFFKKDIMVKIGDGKFQKRLEKLREEIQVYFKDKLSLVEYFDLRFERVIVKLNR
ncbi:MAG: FtsQ-type POTRA domain-containing protein [Candidatus Omnitrophica bacterium]|nr:FtsQ-type POTRA domain-containing protein [Candidatus Omnitrophota bacterium]